MTPAIDADAPRWEISLRRITILIARLGLAYLFFTQLFWKLPPTFGCSNDFAFPTPASQNYWQANGSGGLCYWMGLESVFAPQDRQVLVADMRPAGLPKIGLNIAPLAQLNALIIDNVFKPGIAFWGWLLWLAEFWVFVSLLFGFLTRLGALAALGVSLQLYIGLANIPRPYEWEWSYGGMILLSLLMLGLGVGRWLGLDAVLRRRLAARPAPRRFLARLLMALT